MSDSAQATAVIQNKLGLHTRAATLLVQLASTFPCEVYIAKGDQEVNGKSIMGILMLVASCGTTIGIRCEGERAKEACAAIIKLVDSKFGEPE